MSTGGVHVLGAVKPKSRNGSQRTTVMTIVRWDPFRDFGFTAPSTWTPPVDIFQTGDHELVLKAELPDMSREDIDINIENFVLTIKGEKKVSTDVNEEQYHHAERRYGT